MCETEILESSHNSLIQMGKKQNSMKWAQSEKWVHFVSIFWRLRLIGENINLMGAIQIQLSSDKAKLVLLKPTSPQ